MRRTHLVRQRTRLKNQVHGILARNLAPTCPHADLFSGVGRRWLAAQDLPADERRSAEALMRQLDFHGDELAGVERDIACEAIDDPIVTRLMTVPGIDVDRGHRGRRCGRGLLPLRQPGSAGVLSRVEPAGASVRQLAGGARSDHARPVPLKPAGCSSRPHSPRPARRPAASVLSPRQGPSRVPGRHRRRCPQADRAVLAPRHQRARTTPSPGPA